METVTAAMLFVSVLFPSKAWFAPDEPYNVLVKSPAQVTLVLTNFAGQKIDATKPELAEITAEKTVDLKQVFPLAHPGTYVLSAVPKGAALKDFVGTPLVVDVREDRRVGAPQGPMVVRVRPLVYATMETQRGSMTIAFYLDAAPHTVENFLSLAQENFYDGQGFHRIVPEFVIQAGDPRGDGSGGPGYTIHEEFNDRPHEAGVLSMARQGDPQEPAGMPRCEFANTAGSQFFICLNYENTKQLDRRYTAFGKVVEGMETVRTIGAIPVPDPRTGRPAELVRIKRLTVHGVTSRNNPYAKLNEVPATTLPSGAATQPATAP